jgi:hypothetical protein
MARRKDPLIPRTALREGIVHCLSVASLRLEETDTLLKQDLPTQAGVVFSFAVEEFGKAALLRRAIESGADPALIQGFYDHRVKLAAAVRHVEPTFLLLTPLSLDVMGFGLFPLGLKRARKADLAARLAGLYVDWQDRWLHGLRVHAPTLAASSSGLQSAIQKAMISWT